jgi:hypothetical protein
MVPTDAEAPLAAAAAVAGRVATGSTMVGVASIKRGDDDAGLGFRAAGVVVSAAGARYVCCISTQWRVGVAAQPKRLRPKLETR